MKNWKRSLGKTLKFAGPLGTMSGFLADVMSPLVDVSLYLLVLSIIVLCISLYIYKKNISSIILQQIKDGQIDEEEADTLRDDNIWVKTISISSVATVIFTLTFCFNIIYPKKGLLASKIPMFEEIQKLLILSEQNLEISKTIKADTTELKKGMNQIATGIKTVGEGFNPNPMTKGQFYANIKEAHNRGSGVIEKHLRALLDRYPISPPDYVAQVLTWSLIDSDNYSFIKAHIKTKELFKEYNVDQTYASTWEASIKKRDEKTCAIVLKQNKCHIEYKNNNLSTNCMMLDYIMDCNQFND